MVKLKDIRSILRMLLEIIMAAHANIKNINDYVRRWAINSLGYPHKHLWTYAAVGAKQQANQIALYLSITVLVLLLLVEYRPLSLAMVTIVNQVLQVQESQVQHSTPMILCGMVVDLSKLLASMGLVQDHPDNII